MLCQAAVVITRRKFRNIQLERVAKRLKWAWVSWVLTAPPHTPCQNVWNVL